MSQKRYTAIREKMSVGMSSSANAWFFARLPDGDRAHYFVGPEKEVRKLAKKTAAQWSVKWWRLEPMCNKSTLYKGGPAYQDDTVMLTRIDKENKELSL